jgi:hypothetical protein
MPACVFFPHNNSYHFRFTSDLVCYNLKKLEGIMLSIANHDSVLKKVLVGKYL